MVNCGIIIPEGFLEDEKRDGYIIYKSKKKLWAILIDLLYQLDIVCKKNNLQYYVDSGTLLGTVREKGFIPWDDDIDVVMFREDYNQLIRNCYKEFKHPYFLQSAYTDDKYLRTHAQLRNSMTTAMLPNEAKIVKFNQGIFLDIFPLDYLPEKENELRKKFRKLDHYRNLFRDRMYGDRTLSTVKKISKSIIRSYVFRKGDVSAFLQFEKLCAEPAGTCIDKVSYYYDLDMYRRLSADYFGEPKLLDFEFIKVPVPQKYDKVLESYYGCDYMIPKQLPSNHQAFGNLIIDVERPYVEIIKEI